MVTDRTPTGGGTGDPTAVPVAGLLEESPLQILVRHGAARTHVVLSGELDGATAPFLVRTLVEINDSLEGDLVLDINALSFIDSTGLSVFVSQHKQLSSKGKGLVIHAPTAMARRLFQITGLDDVLTIELVDESERRVTSEE